MLGCYQCAIHRPEILRFGLLGGHHPHEARLCHFGHHGVTGANLVN
jgi:hypothetical protein